MIKGPGHTPPNQIVTTVQLEKQVCLGAPYFVFGPVSTDVAPGYDCTDALAMDGRVSL